MFDEELFRAIVRGVKRQIEDEVIEELRSIPPGLLLLTPQDRSTEREQPE